jgi:polygalacturonase
MKALNVSEFGAIGDGRTVNTEAIQKTIDACICQLAVRLLR